MAAFFERLDWLGVSSDPIELHEKKKENNEKNKDEKHKKTKKTHGKLPEGTRPGNHNIHGDVNTC